MIKALFVDRGGTLAAVFGPAGRVSYFRQTATPWMRPGTAVSDSSRAARLPADGAASLETLVGDGESMYGDLLEDVNSETPDGSTCI